MRPPLYHNLTTYKKVLHKDFTASSFSGIQPIHVQIVVRLAAQSMRAWRLKEIAISVNLLTCVMATQLFTQ